MSSPWGCPHLQHAVRGLQGARVWRPSVTRACGSRDCCRSRPRPPGGGGAARSPFRAGGPGLGVGAAHSTVAVRRWPSKRAVCPPAPWPGRARARGPGPPHRAARGVVSFGFVQWRELAARNDKQGRIRRQFAKKIELISSGSWIGILLMRTWRFNSPVCA